MEFKVSVSSSFLVLLAATVVLTVKGAVEYSGPHNSDSINFNKFLHHKHYIHRHTRQEPVTPPPGNTNTIDDDHDYYTSTNYSPGPQATALWFELDGRNGAEVANISDNFRFYSIHALPFEFQFYGHTINRVAITTGGFLYVGTYYHEFIHLTQFIAPLQADFNPGVNDTARVLYYGDNDRYTVQWDEILNHDHVNDGPFTFQVSLFRNGTIHFVYKRIPLAISDINDVDHPVTVGLADSFYIDNIYPGGVIFRTIYEYHRITLDTTLVTNNSAFIIDPVPNCIAATSCDECTALTQTSMFECGWCEKLSRCSDSIDRHRQEWFESGCALSNVSNCNPTPQPSASTQLGTGPIVGIIVVIFVLIAAIALVSACIFVVWYGYKNPTSPVGLFMIEHRPRARTLNKTAASYNVETGKTALSDEA